PVARVVAVVEVALDRLAQAVRAVRRIDFPARREDRRAAIRILRRRRILRQRARTAALREHERRELTRFLVAREDAGPALVRVCFWIGHDDSNLAKYFGFVVRMRP